MPDNGTILPPASDIPTAAPLPAVSRWALHRRMYNWVLSFAQSRHATGALFLLAFTEACFFPIPPDVLLMPMAMGNRRKAMWFATVCTAGSVLGGLMGYYIGFALWEAVHEWVYSHLAFLHLTRENIEHVCALYQDNAFWAVFAAGFTPIPYKVFTIAGGIAHLSLATFVIASILSRGLRFYAVAGLMWLFGPPIVKFIDRYFNLLSVVFTALLVGGFLVLKMFK